MDDTDYAFEDETYVVIGAALEVLSQLGHGIHEKPYENALLIELRLREICCRQQTRFDVVYKTVKVG
jgi:GxxExxY protein